MTIQEVFKRCINLGLYSPSQPFMCNAIKGGMRKGLIGYSAGHDALDAIASYIHDFGVLHTFIWEMQGEGSKEPEFEDLLAIYKNWNKRPFKDIGQAEVNRRSKEYNKV